MDYKEKLEEAKRLYETANADQKYLLESLFPELKSRADERIMANCIHFLNLQKSHHASTVEIDECIDWLECQVKESLILQQENKTCNENNDPLTSEDERIRKEIITFIVTTPKERNNHQKWIAWLEKHGETENEDDTDFTIYHPLKNGSGKYECIPYSFYGSLTSFSEDEDLINFLRNCFYTEKECKEWIEKQGEQKPTWSDEDVAMLDSAIAFVSHSPFTVIGKGKSNVIAWLKSLKDRYTWKPSEEIMKGLNEIINKLAISPVIHEHGYLYDLMVNLRKKLKG